MKKRGLILVIVLIVVGGSIATYEGVKILHRAKENVPAAVDLTTFVSQEHQTQQNLGGENATNSQQVVQNVSVPAELNFSMTFYSQAPFGDWSEPWQNACEEASSLLIANTYFHHNWTPEQFRDQILTLVDWENKTFGDYKSTNAKEIVQMLHDELGLNAVIHSNPSFEDVQQVLAEGHLIIMTFDGRELNNPFYTNGGPDYHAMVIKGYKEGQKVITEDVGTKHGENYVYDWSTLENASHDYTTPNIDDGAKLMIEVLPPDSDDKSGF